MTIPTLGVGTSVALKTESSPGVRESITGGGSSVEFLDILSENLDYMPVLNAEHNLAGARQAQGDMQFISHNDGGGGIIFRPRYAQMAELFTLILAAVDTTYRPSAKDTDLGRFTVECIKSGQNDLALIGCKMNTATFRSNQNTPLELELGIVASSGLRDPGDCTALDITTMAATDPFVHARLVMTSTDEAWLGGATPEPIRSMEITLNNNLDVEAYCNGIDRAVIPVGLFTMTGMMVVPYSSVTKAFWTEQAAKTKVEFSIEWEDGASGNNMKFALVATVTGDLPKISGPETQWLTVNFNGITDATDVDCIAVTLAAGA